jgi:cell division protein FtsB
MGTKTRNVRYPDWMMKAVEAFRVKNGYKTRSDVLLFLLETQLNRYGYYREDYTVLSDLPLTNDNPDPTQQRSVDDEVKKLKLKNEQLERQVKKLKNGKTPDEMEAEGGPGAQFKKKA